ncbi:MAG: hypothetical protein ACRCVT_03750, partial [Leadbetterella sp.]
MNENELRRQKILAKAHLDSAQQSYEHGLISEDELSEKKAIWEGLQNYTLPTFFKPPPVSKIDTHEGINLDNIIYDSSTEEAAELIQIRVELNEIDLQKNRKINELAKLPRNVNQKDVVNQIKELRQAYINKSDEIYYFKRHGERVSVAEVVDPELYNFDDSEYVKSLPKDKLELHRLKKNLETYKSKYQARLRDAKTEVKKAQQNRNISEVVIKINT